MIHSRFNKIATAVLLSVVLVGCGTTSNENVAYWQAQQAKYNAIQAVETAKATTEAIRFMSAAKASETADAGGKAAIGVSLATGKPSAESSNASKSIMFAADSKPESTDDKIFKWSNLVLGILVPELRRDRDSKRQAEVASKQAEYDYLTNRDTANAFVEMGRTIKPTYNNSFNGPGATVPE